MKIRRLARQRLGPAGVSLVELLIVTAIVGVVTTGMYTLFLADGVQGTRLTVTAMVTGANPGLRHVPANDMSSVGGSAYTYPVAMSMVYGVKAGTKDPSVPPDGFRRQRFTSTAQRRNFGA